MTENEKKTILDTYALSLRLAASDATARWLRRCGNSTR